MNKIYRLIWNAARGMWQVAAEIGASRGKSPSQTRSARSGVVGARSRTGAAIGAGALLLVHSSLVFATLPTDGSVTAGSGSISQSGGHMTIDQSTHKMAIDWQGFSIGRDNSVTFSQPSSSAVALNRVLGSDVSVIQGAINANGQVFLINPNGVLFTTTAQVNVGGMVASTLSISNEDFLAGNYRFEGASGNAIINQGNIQAIGDGTGGGYIAMIAARIENTGSLTARQGDVLMGAGSMVTLDLGGPVKIEVEAGAIDALIEQGGAIKADGGLVYLTAKAAGDLVTTVINHTGITEAQTLATGERGEIYLMGDMNHGRIEVAGTLDASAPNGGDGGFIETSAANVQIQPDLVVTTKAENGKTGEWLIDPNDFTIAASGGNMTGTVLGTNLGTTDVTIESVNGTAGGNGDIFVNDEVTWSSGNTLTLNAIRNIEVNAAMDASGGTGGRLVLEYGQGAVAAGNTATYTINAPVSLQNRGNANGQNGITATNFSTKLGSDGAVQNFTTISTHAALAGVTTAAAAARYALGADIDLTGVAWTPIGSGTSFFGQLDGLGHTVSNLTHTGTQKLGLFAEIYDAKISNLKLASFNITTTESPDITARVAALVGYANGGSFYNIGFNNIAISSTGIHADYAGTGASTLGGLIGHTSSRVLNISRIRGEDISVSGILNLGGLIGGTGSNSHTISDVQLNNVSLEITGHSGSFSSTTGGLFGMFASAGGTISKSSVTNLSVTTKDNANWANGWIGGIAGALSGTTTLSQTYATGTIVANNYTGTHVGLAAKGSIGGLVGRFMNGGSIENSYSTVNITLNGNQGSFQGMGGLVGSTVNTTSITNSYATGVVSSGNLTGTSLDYIGGFVGSNATANGLTLSGNFWDTETSTRANAIGTTTSAFLGTAPVGKTTTELYQPKLFTDAGWNTSIWSFSGGLGAAAEGYEVIEALPYLTNVTREQDIVTGAAYTLFAGGWGGQTDQQQAGANGTAYTITNATQLQNINLVVGDGFDFELSNAIDLDGVTWNPIGSNTGDFSTSFNGSFNGQNYTISNLTVGGVDQTNVGLFGFIHNATLTNIHLDGVQASGGSFVAGLVGRTSHSTNTIKNISITSTLRDSRIELSRTGGQGNYFGAVGGYIVSSLENIESHATVFLSDAINQPVSRVGGLVGKFFPQSIDAPNNLVNHGDVIVNLTGDSNINTGVQRIGGLFGNYSYDTPLSNVEMKGNVIAVTQAGVSSVGGIFGTGSLNINNAVMRGDVRTHITIGGTQYISGTAYGIGGLFGDSGGVGEIANSAMYGNVEVLLSGPLVEWSWNNYGFGGVLGVSWGDVTFNNVHAYGDVTLEIPGEPVEEDGFSTGGLLGETWGNLNIIDSTMEGNISGLNGVGGLTGIAWYGAEINNSHFLGDTISGHDHVGGLLGQIHDNWGSNTDSLIVTRSFSKGTLSGNDYVGGLVGKLSNENVAAHEISQSYSTATVTADGDFAGGLVGWMSKAAIDNSYFAGTVSGANTVGGLVGQMTADSSLTNTYSSAVVTGTPLIGGLVGVNANGTGTNVTNSFWNTTGNSGLNSAGGVGKTTTELQTLSTFTDAGWNIASTTSATYTGNPYPGLRMAAEGAVWQIYVATASPPPPAPPPPAPEPEPAPEPPPPAPEPAPASTDPFDKPITDAQQQLFSSVDPSGFTPQVNPAGLTTPVDGKTGGSQSAFMVGGITYMPVNESAADSEDAGEAASDLAAQFDEGSFDASDSLGIFVVNGGINLPAEAFDSVDDTGGDDDANLRRRTGS